MLAIAVDGSQRVRFGEPFAAMIEKARIAPVAIPGQGVDLPRPQRLQAGALRLQPTCQPLPFAEQRLVRDFHRTRIALAHHQPPLIEPREHVALLVVETGPVCDAADCALVVHLRERGHEGRFGEVEPTFGRRSRGQRDILVG